MDIPTTPFEDSGGNTPTSLSEGEMFLDLVGDLTGRLTKFKIGDSASGLPIYGYAVTTSSPVVVTDLADSYLVIASQHGQERTPREAALQVIRNLCFSDDPQIVSQLGRVPAVFVPTANPDGTVNNRRNNGNDVDINRDHIALSQPESKAIARLICMTNAAFLYDGHQTGSGPFDINCAYFGPGAAPSIKAYADVVQQELTNLFAGNSVGLYNLANHEGTLTHATSLRGIANIIVEPYNTQPVLDMVDQHVVAMTSLYLYMSNTTTSPLAVRDAARYNYAKKGYLAYSPYYGYESGSIPATLGYKIPPGVLDEHMRLLGINYHPSSDSSGNYFVSMAQPSAEIIPLLMDPLAPRAVFRGEPVGAGSGYYFGTKDSGYTDLGYQIDLGGGRIHPRGLVVQHGGIRSVVWGTFDYPLGFAP